MSHLVGPVVTGMCAACLPLAVVPLWQVSHVPVPTALAAECAYTTPLVQLVVDLWQLSQLPVTEECTVVLGLPVTPYAVVRWQLAHCVDTDTLAWNFPGFHNVVPPLWQVSQLAIATPVIVLYGMWFAVTGSAPCVPWLTKLPLWQVSHPVAVTTAWFMVYGETKLVCEVWQLSHLVGPVVTGMCPACLPLAVVPLWQVSQVPVPIALADA